MVQVNKSRRLFLLFVSPSLIVIQFVIGYYILQHIVQVNRLEDRHTKTELYLRNQLMSLINAETGQRGFLLTDKPEYLEPYHLGLQQMEQNDTLLNELTGIKGSEKFEELQRLTHNKLAIMQQTIELSSRGKKDSAMAIVATNTGKLTMDSIRNHVDTYLSTVFRSVEDARSELQKLILVFILVMAGMLLFQLAFSIYTYFSMVGFSNNMLKLVDDLASTNKALMDFTFMSYHQLKEPLRNISGFIQLLLKRNAKTFDKESHDFAQQAIKATEQMNSTINSLRDEHLKRKEN